MSVITVDIYEAGGMGSIKLATGTMSGASTSVNIVSLANGVSSIPLGKNVTIHSRAGSSAKGPNGESNSSTFNTRSVGGNGTTTLTTAHANPH